MAFTIGENVGSYRIIAQLGQGGMATVFKAYHPGLDRYVALKVLHPSFKEDASFTQRFSREARIVARLEHPNIVPIYDYAEHRGLAYLVMRFIDGETLKARLRRGPLRPEQIIQVAHEIGAALNYAHQQGILHRDIKPSNILLTGDPADPDALGQLFLADFGLARIAEAGESTLSRDMMMGTPQYISPEQAKGERDLDAGTDIYSLGVVLFELVTGRVPFSADTPYSIIHDHIFSPLPLPRSIKPDLPEPVERVLLRALAKDRADRFPDVDSFVQTFVGAMQGAPGAPAAPPTVVHAAARPATVVRPAPETPDATEAAARPVPPVKKKRRVWLWILLAMLAIFFCLAALTILGNVVEKGQARATATAEAQTAAATATAAALRPGPELPAGVDTAVAEKIATLEKLITENPNDAFLHMDLGFKYLEVGLKEDAYEQLRQAVELRPENEGLYLDIGRHFMDQNAWAQAALVYAVGVEVLPDSEPLHFNLAVSVWRLGAPENDPQLAVDLSRRFALAAPDQALPHLLLARALISQGKMVEARKEIDTAMEMGPDSAEKHLVNGLWLRKDGQRVAASRELRLALELAGDQEWLRIEIERELDKAD